MNDRVACVLCGDGTDDVKRRLVHYRQPERSSWDHDRLATWDAIPRCGDWQGCRERRAANGLDWNVVDATHAPTLAPVLAWF